MPGTLSSTLGPQRDQAYQSLRRLLVLQQVEAGQRLREPEWAEKLGIHRSALREAFARLEAEGLLTKGEKTGYFVPALTEADLAEITRLRLAFECLAIENIVLSTQNILTPAIKACDEFEQFFQGDYSLGVMEADRRFHEALIDAAGMRRLSSLYHRAPLPLINRRTEDPRGWEDACSRTLGEHRAILKALQGGERDEAKSLLRTHLLHRPQLPIRR